jgi:peroxiredoxin/glutaredoxin
MLSNSEGKNVPQVTFPVRVKGDWTKWTSDDLFKGKKVILFALPGAFTPTCSSTHLPRYNDLASTFKGLGVDDIICLSVNDTFVMNAWAEDQEAENITFLPDGTGEFSEKMDMLVDKSDIGFGKRSWRYSMYIENGVIKKMFIEPDKPGDPFEVSDADTMLNYLAPDAKVPDEVVIFTKEGCPHCARAKEILNEKNIHYKEVAGVRTPSLRAMGGEGTYPLVFLNGEKVGGTIELEKKFS